MRMINYKKQNMPFRFTTITMMSAEWTYDPVLDASLFEDERFSSNLQHVSSLHITTAALPGTNRSVVLPSLNRFTRLQTLTIKDANIAILTDFGITTEPDTRLYIKIINTDLTTLDNVDCSSVYSLFLVGNANLRITHIPLNTRIFGARNQTFGDLYVNPYIERLSLIGSTRVDRILNIFKSELDSLYISETCIHPYDFKRSLSEDDTFNELITKILHYNKEHHYESYAMLGSIPSRIIVPEATPVITSPIIQVFGLSANYPRRMAEFVVDTEVV